MSSDFSHLIETAVNELRERSHGNSSHEPDAPLPLDPGDWTWFQRSVDFRAPDLMTLTKEQLLERFPSNRPTKHPPINDSRLLTTFVWQIFLKAKAGLIGPVEGNIRSLWYQHVQNFYRSRQLIPVKSSTGKVVTKASDIIADLMGERLERLVLHRIFRYRDELKFSRPLNCAYLIGTERPGLLFFTEKEGLWKFCQSLYGTTGNKALAGKSISVMASNGQPSLLALEYLAHDLREHEVRELRIGCLCDYDHYGYLIAESMDEKMRRFGFKTTSWTLTTENLFSQAEVDSAGEDFTELLLRAAQNPREANRRAMIYSWLRLTHGIHRRAIQVHVDNADVDKRVQRVKWFFEKLIAHQVPRGIPEVVPGEFDRLKAEMADYLGRLNDKYERLEREGLAYHPLTEASICAESHEINRDALDGSKKGAEPIKRVLDWYR